MKSIPVKGQEVEAESKSRSERSNSPKKVSDTRDKPSVSSFTVKHIGEVDLNALLLCFL